MKLPAIVPARLHCGLIQADRCQVLVVRLFAPLEGVGPFALVGPTIVTTLN